MPPANTPTHHIIISSLLIGLLIGVIWLYWPGLNSSFIFDDIPNLDTMGLHQNLGLWRDIALYLLQGDSGPTGRPISLLSFYLNDSAWKGANADDFKYTNLMLHALNGVLIFWLSIILSSKISIPTPRRHWLALAATALWLLHPMQVNTVLYVVQRMTELSTLFILTGLLCYLHGRQQLCNNLKQGWWWLILGGGLSLVLAVLGKENGVLLVVYILATEHFLLRPFSAPAPAGFRKGLTIFVWVPFLLLLAYLVKTGISENAYAARPFTLVERLLTEARVLWEYIGDILLPKPGKFSLFHDDFIISQGLLNPSSTLFAVIGLLLLLAVAFLLYRRLTVASFAIIWFLGGHLLESTTIPLELYFEHRNYLPLYGPLFAVAYYGINTENSLPILQKTLPALLLAYICLLISVTNFGVQQWTNPVQMVAGWLQNHPHSQRTLETLDVLIGEHINPSTRKKLLEELKASSQQTNTSSYTVLRDALLACQGGTLTSNQLQDTAEQLKATGFVAATPKVFADLASTWLDKHCEAVTANEMLAFTDNLSNMKNLQYGGMLLVLHTWQAEIQARQGNLDATIHHLEAAYALSPSVDNLLQQANYLGSAGLYQEAIKKLQQAKTGLCRDRHSCLILKIRQPELDTMLGFLQEQSKQQKANNHAQVVDYLTRQE